LWTGYFREHAYGMSNQTLGGWFGDWGKGLVVGTLLASPLIAALYAVVRRTPRSWWLWGTGVALAFLVFAIAISPVYVAPLFNRYQRLEAGPLRDEILSLARAYRIPADDVWWFDASRQTKRVSANVSGVAGTTRISLNDNLLRRSPRETVLAVLGHEMGHYVLGHVRILVLSIGLLIAAGFACVHFGFERLARRRPAWSLHGVGDPAGLPLAVALFSTFFLLATPLTNTIIRTSEAEADAFGLAAARQPDGFAYAAVQLSEYRKMRPGWLEEVVFYDHPSGYDRIRRAMTWKAENLAESAGRERAAAAP
jgi:STE24 endopeptidase